MLIRVIFFADPQLEGKNMTFYDSHGELKDVKFIF